VRRTRERCSAARVGNHHYAATASVDPLRLGEAGSPGLRSRERLPATDIEWLRSHTSRRPGATASSACTAARALRSGGTSDRPTRPPARPIVAVVGWRSGSRPRPDNGRVGARSLLLGLVPLLAVLHGSCDGEAVTLDVGAPVDPPARPAAEIAVWGPSGAIRIVRIGDSGAGRRRLVGIGDVRRFFLDRVAWSPDGRRLAFTAESGLGYRQINIWTVDGDGGDLRRVTRTGDALWPVWAPDGRSIVYARLEDLGRDSDGSLDHSSSLWAIDPDGSNPRRLSDPAAGVIERPWSFAPDGSRLAITRARPPALERRAARTRIALVDLDGSGERELGGTGTDPAFSPDGSRIAYASARDRNGTLDYGDLSTVATELYLMDADGSNRRRLTRTRRVDELTPSWSPAGTTLAYTRGRPYQNAEVYSIWQVNPDGSCPAALLAGRARGAWYASPVWRPARAPRRSDRRRC
jgi:WD40-like Beta Propeller Repeat